jgi:hypothetical protein
MIREIVTATDGTEIELWRPENAADVREMQRMAEAGELDDSEMTDIDDNDETDMVEAGLLPPND